VTQVRVLPDPGTLYAAAATEVVGTLAAAVAERSVAHWATTGGSAAPGIYRGLVAASAGGVLDWGRIHTWWGDERFVPHDDPLSNVLPSRALGLPPATTHPVPTDEAIARGEGPAWAAERYAEELRSDGPKVEADGWPVFDLVILGVGPDGHILSVFPGSAAWDAPRWVAAVPAPTHVEPHVARVTLNPALVAAARQVMVITAGTSKADVVARAWAGDDVRELPLRAARLPTATWMLDEAAAAALPDP
jgi:6-phosphogluconolactonase